MHDVIAKSHGDQNVPITSAKFSPMPALVCSLRPARKVAFDHEPDLLPPPQMGGTTSLCQ